jgi:hypothetical protein
MDGRDARPPSVRLGGLGFAKDSAAQHTERDLEIMNPANTSDAKARRHFR